MKEQREKHTEKTREQSQVFFFLHFVTHPLSVVLPRTNYTAMRLIIADA